MQMTDLKLSHLLASEMNAYKLKTNKIKIKYTLFLRIRSSVHVDVFLLVTILNVLFSF